MQDFCGCGKEKYMILQNILSPHSDTCNESAMFFRVSGKKISYDTYYNSFSISKWLEYTTIKSFALSLRAIGKFCVEIWDTKRKLDEYTYDFEHESDFTLELPYRDDSFCLYFTFIKHSDNAAILSGCYCTKEKNQYDIALALCICTYRREEYIQKNIKILKEKILNDSYSSLFNKTYIYIIDNGKTLGIETLSDDKISIFPNINAGGTGGFARGILEILADQQKRSLTHIILMDDDVVIEPDAFVRTFALLSYVKENYRKSCVAGAMLRLDMRQVQHGVGDCWQGGDPIIGNAGLDLSCFAAVCKNEELRKADFAAWWFACYPLGTVVRKDNMPIPFFLHFDDVEFGLRNPNGLMMLNGINVWHSVFEHNGASSRLYYNVRNNMIANATLSPDGRKSLVFRYILKRIGVNILRCRYKDVEVIYLAVKDFCKGLDYLKTLNPERKHKEISALGYTMRPLGDLIQDPTILHQVSMWKKPTDPDLIYRDSAKNKKFKYIISLLGLMLPAKQERVSSYPFGVDPYSLYRKREVVLFDPDTYVGIRVRKDWKMLFRCLFNTLATIKLLCFEYENARQDYKERIQEVCTAEFWIDYLRVHG